jgi:glycopeptide antibiotics resistance protein
LLKSFAISCFVAYLIVLFKLTLGFIPSGIPAEASRVNLVPFENITADLQAGGKPFVINFVGNLVAFLPVGVFLIAIRRGKTSAREVALLGSSISLVIEFMQYRSAVRVADIDDVILNTAGSLIGYGLVRGIICLVNLRSTSSVKPLTNQQ